MIRRAPLACAAALLLSGCVATQKDVLELSQRSDDLKAQVEDLKKTVSSMQANQADLSVQIRQLREDLTAYSETVKASMGNMEQLSSKLDAMAAQLSGKVTQLGATLSAEQQKGLREQQARLEEQGRETAATELLLTAEKRLQARDYAQAAAGLENYLKKFPGGALTDVASYDLGLAYYGLRSWEKAGRQFALVLEKYPKSGQTPAARLHYALCLLRLRKSRHEAQAYLQSIVDDFPGSPESRQAVAELKRLPAKAPVK